MLVKVSYSVFLFPLVLMPFSHTNVCPDRIPIIMSACFRVVCFFFRSRKLFTVTTFALAGTALAVYGAKNDDDLREWAKSNVPALDGMVKIVYQEEETYKELLQSIYKELTKG